MSTTTDKPARPNLTTIDKPARPSLTIALILLGAPLVTIPVFYLTNRRITHLTRRIATLEAVSHRPFFNSNHSFFRPAASSIKQSSSTSPEPWVGPSSNALIDANAACMRPKQRSHSVGTTIAATSESSSAHLKDHASLSKEFETDKTNLANARRLVAAPFPQPQQLDARDIRTLRESTKLLSEHAVKLKDLRSRSGSIQEDVRSVRDSFIDVEDRLKLLTARVEELQHLQTAHTTLENTIEDLHSRISSWERQNSHTAPQEKLYFRIRDYLLSQSDGKADLEKVNEQLNTMKQRVDALQVQLQQQRSQATTGERGNNQLIAQRLLVSSLADIAAFMYKVELETGIAAGHTERVRAYAVKMQGVDLFH